MAIDKPKDEFVFVTIATRKSDGLTRIHVYAGPPDKPWTKAQAKKAAEQTWHETEVYDYDGQNKEWLHMYEVKRILRETVHYEPRDSNSYWPKNTTSASGD